MIHNYITALVPASFSDLQSTLIATRDAITSRVASLDPSERIQYITDRARNLGSRVTTSLSNYYASGRETITSVWEACRDRMQIEANAVADIVQPPQSNPQENAPVAPTPNQEITSNNKTHFLLYVLAAFLGFLAFIVFLVAGLDTALAMAQMVRDYVDPHTELVHALSN